MPTHEWRLQAACRGESRDLFYSDEAAHTRAALSVCARCPVRTCCLDEALGRGEWFGVWGGMTEGQRRKVLRAGRGSGTRAA